MNFYSHSHRDGKLGCCPHYDYNLLQNKQAMPSSPRVAICTAHHPEIYDWGLWCHPADMSLLQYHWVSKNKHTKMASSFHWTVQPASRVNVKFRDGSPILWFQSFSTQLSNFTTLKTCAFNIQRAQWGAPSSFCDTAFGLYARRVSSSCTMYFEGNLSIISPSSVLTMHHVQNHWNTASPMARA